MKWFEVTFKLNDNTEKKVERYLIDALTFAEAETRMVAYLLGESGNAEVEVETENGARLMQASHIVESECMTVKMVKISEVIMDDSKEAWFRVRVNFVTLDEKSGQEKLSPSTWMVEANSIKEAIKIVDDEMHKGVSDYDIVKVEKTDIVELVQYKNNDN